jgi:hypothetical protein
MKRVAVLFIMLLSFNYGFSETYSVNGKIIDKTTGNPVESACVYFANTTTGVYTNYNGEFKLSYPHKGEVNLVVSHVSYQTFSQKLILKKDSMHIIIELQVKVYDIQPVGITMTDPERNLKLEIFSKGLIGQSRNALRCKLLNPDVLRFRGKIPDRKIEAEADSTLIIQNKALGYIIRYNLVYFNFGSWNLSYYGYPYFEDQSGPTGNQRRVLTHRKEAYEGSKLHFFRSLYNNRLAEEGFVIHEVIEKARDSVSLVQIGLLGDTMIVNHPRDYLVQTNEILNLNDYVLHDSISGAKILAIQRPFEVVYTQSGEEYRYDDFTTYHVGMKRTRNMQTTIVRLKKGFLKIYTDGSCDKPDELITVGYWSYKQLADLLPYNYHP